MNSDLFSSGLSDNFLRNKENMCNSHINQLSVETIKNTDESQFIENVYSMFKFESPVLLTDNAEKVTPNYKEKILEVKIPFTGDADLFNMSPSLYWTGSSVEGVVDSTNKFVTIYIRDLNDLNKTLNSLTRNIAETSKQCIDLNSQLKSYIEKCVKQRYKEITELDTKAEELNEILQKIKL